MEPITKITRNLKCDLTPEEWEAQAMRHAEVEQGMRSLEAQRKQVTADLKAQKEALDAELERIGHKVRTKTEYREIECEQQMWPREGVVVVIRLDTGDEIERRPMFDSERQLELVDQDRPPNDDGADEEPETEPEPTPLDDGDYPF